jgi:hypothetical protein
VDTGLLTLCLLPEEGLEIFQPDTKKWVEFGSLVAPEHAKLKQCQCVVLYGETLSRLTHDKVPATMYRIVSKSKNQSAMLFKLRPRPDVVGPRTTADYRLLELRAERKRDRTKRQDLDAVWQHIFLFLPLVDVVTSAAVCKLWAGPLRVGRMSLWKSLARLRWADVDAYPEIVDWQTFCAVQWLREHKKPGLIWNLPNGRAVYEQLKRDDKFDPPASAQHAAQVDQHASLQHFRDDLVLPEEGDRLAKELGANGFFITSSVYQKNLKQCFETAVLLGLNKKPHQQKKKKCIVQ